MEVQRPISRLAAPGDLQKGRCLVNFPYAYYRLNAMLEPAQKGQKLLPRRSISGATGPHYEGLDLVFPPFSGSR